MEKRRYRRLETNFIAKIRGRKASAATMRQVRTVVSNISRGGVFIETATPFPMGEIIELDFALPGKQPVHAKGVVRWSSRQGDQPGMGVEFIEVAFEEKKAIENYVEKRVVEEGTAALTKTDRHRELLGLWARKVGEIFSIAVVRSYLGCEPMEAITLVEEFAAQGIMKLDGDMVRFLKCEEPELDEAIRGLLGRQEAEEESVPPPKVKGGTRGVRGMGGARR